MDNNKSAQGSQDLGPSSGNQEAPFYGGSNAQQVPNSATPYGQQGQPMPSGAQQYPQSGQYGAQIYGGNSNPAQTPPDVANPMQSQQYQQSMQQPMPRPMQQPEQQQGQVGDGVDGAQNQDRSKQDVKHAAHAKKAQSAFIQRSSKMRKLYVVIIILLVIIVAVIGVMGARMIWTADNSATQQTQSVSTDLTDVGSGDDTKDNETPETTVPNIVELLGHTKKQALEMVGHGADVVSNRKVKEEGSAVRRELRVELTDEPSDSKSGAPTVYLSLNKAGKVIHAGYSVATSSLGYGSASFSDTIESEHIVENTLGQAGLNVEIGSAVLPDDATEYSSYSSDGSTVTKEYCSFSGKGTANGKQYDWEAILSYDYTVANASENLNDTLRTIFVYVS